MTDVPSSGNDPHHLGPSLDGKTLVGGGLLSLLKTQDTAFYFDTTNPYRPAFLKSNRAIFSSIADEIRAKPGGGFYITYMGSAVGTSPGRLVETDANFNIIHEWPEDPASLLNILGEQFSPHGLSIDWERKFILTSDFVEPVTILKPTLGIRRANTLRLWNLDTKAIISTITIPNVSSPPRTPFKLSVTSRTDKPTCRAAASKTSSSSPATPKVRPSRLLSISARSGSSTPCARTETASRVSPSCCSTWAPRPATPRPSSKPPCPSPKPPRHKDPTTDPLKAPTFLKMAASPTSP